VILSCLAMLGVRYVVLPRLDSHREDVAALLARELGIRSRSTASPPAGTAGIRPSPCAACGCVIAPAPLRSR